MPVIVDTSVWIDYFRDGGNSEKLDFLIDENLVALNDLILAELVPFLKIRRQHQLIDLLSNVRTLPIMIDWQELIAFQTACLKNGLNGIGIPDLIIAQNAKQHGCEIYSLDRHFLRMRDILAVEIMV